MIPVLIVFILTYAVVASERFPRQAVTLLGATSLVLLGVFNMQEALTFVDWETMGLLFGMFVLVAILAEAGFFAWLAATVAERLHYRPVAVFLVFPLLAALMSAFMDSITVMLFLSALTVRLSRIIRIDPVPLIAAEVCAANTGGAATLIGNPPNVILGTMLGFTFNDFLVHTGPLAVAGTLVVVGVFYLTNRRMLQEAERCIDPVELAEVSRMDLITNHRLLKLGLAAFSVAVVLLVSHNTIAPLLKISLSTATAALLPAMAVMLVGGEDTRHIMTKIDIESLLFFMGLFVIVGAMEKTGIIPWLGQQIFAAANGQQLPLIMLLHWGGGVTSAIVDNIPMTLGMAYMMKDIVHLPGAPALSIMVWALALGVDMGGNMTPVGASPNVVAYAYMERHHERIGWPRWIKMTVPPTILGMLVVSGLVMLKYYLNWY